MGLYWSAPGRMGTQLIEEPERLQPRIFMIFIEMLGIYLLRHASTEDWPNVY